MSINGERNKELKRTQKRNELREKKKLKTVYTNPHKNAFLLIFEDILLKQICMIFTLFYIQEFIKG